MVIGIIALLIAILLPALSRARQQANWAKCCSNLKQVVTAMIGYCNDYKGAFPWRASGVQGPRPDPSKTAADFPGANDWIHWQDKSTGYTGAVKVDINESALAPYLGMKDERLREIFRCPSDEVTGHTNRGGIGIYLFSYSMNDRVTADDTGDTDNNTHWMFRKITQVKRPAEKPFFDEEKDPVDGRWIAGMNGDEIATRHVKKGNVAFFDSHVALFGTDDFKKLGDEYADPFGK